MKKLILLKSTGSFYRGLKYYSLFMIIFINTNCNVTKYSETNSNPKSHYQSDGIHANLEIIDLTQKQLYFYNKYIEVDSIERVQVFRDSLYYPYKDVWNGYLGKIETFDAVANYYGIKIIDQINEKNKSFYTEDKDKNLLEAFFEIREGMKALTGHTAKGKWFLLYGPGIANLGGVGNDIFFIDFSFPENKALPSIINWFPHELNHQIYGNLNKDTSINVLELCINEGLAVYVNKLYWNTYGGDRSYTKAMSLGYSEQELENAQQEWDDILSYFEENYSSSDSHIKNSFGSRSKVLKDKLPGAIGYYIGYQIIENYVARYGPDSWKDIYTMNRNEVLNKSETLNK